MNFPAKKAKNKRCSPIFNRKLWTRKTSNSMVINNLTLVHSTTHTALSVEMHFFLLPANTVVFYDLENAGLILVMTSYSLFMMLLLLHATCFREPRTAITGATATIPHCEKPYR